jgi:hypothetical protein
MELPKFIANQCFELYSIDSKFKLDGVKDMDVKIHKKANKKNVTLCLLSETLLVTAECVGSKNKTLLLYPPMPLTHITLEKGIFGSKGVDLLMTGSDMIYSLKISPYVMLILKPVNAEFGQAFLNQLEIAKTNVATQILSTFSKVQEICVLPPIVENDNKIKMSAQVPYHTIEHNAILANSIEPEIVWSLLIVGGFTPIY